MSLIQANKSIQVKKSIQINKPPQAKQPAMDEWNQYTERWLQGVFEHLKRKRVALFVEKLNLGPDDQILDLGSEDGSYLAKYYPYPDKITLADINELPMKKGVKRHGLKGYKVIKEDQPLPFADKQFDAVWCNSAIEHVTLKKSQLDQVDDKEFKKTANDHQYRFAQEIARVGKRYFVQTPYMHFPIESHSLLPLIVYLSHPVRHRLSRWLKKIWIKQWKADFYIYDRTRFASHFPDASDIMTEKAFGLTKALIAYKS